MVTFTLNIPASPITRLPSLETVSGSVGGTDKTSGSFMKVPSTS